MIKKAICAYVLGLFFSGILVTSFSAIAQEQPESATLTNNNTRIQAFPPGSPSDQDPGTLPELVAVAAGAIRAAEHSVDVMLGVITVASFILTFGGLLGIRYLRIQIMDEAKKRAEKDLKAEVNKQRNKFQEIGAAMTYVAKALQQLQESELMKNKEDERKRCLRDGVYSFQRIAELAKKSGDVQQLAWSYSMQAYIYKRLDELDAAINAAEKAIKEVMDFIKQSADPKHSISIDEQIARELEATLASKYYNLAAYCCLKQFKNRCMLNLEKAVQLDPRFKTEAPQEEDFKTVWEDADFQRLIS